MLATSLRGGTAQAEGTIDVAFTVTEDGRITDLRREPGTGEGGGAGDRPAEVDLGYRHLWAPMAELHAHLDKSMTWPRAKNETGSFEGAKTGAKADRVAPWTDEDVRRRMDFALRCAFAHGTRAVRTHLDSQEGRTAPTWTVFADLREDWAGRIALQGVASLGAQKLTGSYGDRVAALAREHGGLLGPVLYPGPEAAAQVARAFDLAEAFGLSLDFHVDENLDPASGGLALVAAEAAKRGIRGVVCGHACSLSVMETGDRQRTIEAAAAAGIGIVALPPTNLYLLDRAAGCSPSRRAMAPALALAAAGVPVAVSSDNCRDPFNPFGDYDLADVFRDAVRLGHTDRTIGDWAGAVGPVPRGLMGDIPALIAEGAAADFVLFSGRSFSEVLSRPGAPRQVVIGGRPVEAPLPHYEDLDDLMPGWPAAGA